MFEDVSLETYRFFFMAELLAAEFLFCRKLHTRSHYWLRLCGMFALSECFAYLLPILSYDSLYQAAYFLILFSFTVLCLFFVYREDWTIIVFFAVASYTSQHIAYEFFQFVVVVFDLNNGLPLSMYASPGQPGFFDNPLFPFIILIYFDSFFLLYALNYFLFLRKFRKGQNISVESTQLLFFVSFVAVIDILLNSLLIGRSYEVYDRVYITLFHVSNIVSCFLSLFFQFRLIKDNELEKDLDVANQLLHQRQEQYSISKENINLINLKVHDLKHQIHEIGSQKAINPEAVKDIENLVSTYDSSVKTGNEALDIILTEKSLYCGQNGIKLTCMVDGGALSFISDADLYSLFGNAIDNAVEAVADLPDDRRIIGLNVRKVESFVSVNLHNYFDRPLVLDEGGLPKTTKGDKAYHGFGIRSIKLVAEKYGGDVKIDADNHVFNLNILFPLPQIHVVKN
jgi:hypothetical protein